MPAAEPCADYDSAQLFLDEARQAEKDGDRTRCLAARKLVAVALGLKETLPQSLCIAHLKEG